MKTRQPIAKPQTPPGARRGAGARRGKRFVLLSSAFGLAGFALAIGLAAWLLGAFVPAVDDHEISRFARHGAGLVGLELSVDDPVVASVDANGEVRIWSPENLEEQATLQTEPGGGRCLALSQDGKLLAIGGESGVTIWNVERKTQALRVGGADSQVVGPATSVAFYPPKTHVLVGGREEIVLWSLESGKPEKRFRAEGEVAALAFLPDGGRFLSGDAQGVVRLWNVHSAREIAHCQAHAGPVRSLAVDWAGGRVVTAGADRAVRLWSVDNLNVIREFTAADMGELGFATLSAGGGRVLAGDELGVVWLWSCESGELLETCRGHRAASSCGKFLPNGFVAITGSADQTARLWRLPPPSEFETRQIAEAARTSQRFKQRMEQLDGHRHEAQRAKDVRRYDDALAELRAAAALAPANTLEGAAVRDAIAEIEAGEDVGRDYIAHVKAAQAARDQEDFAAAVRELEAARAIGADHPDLDLPGRSELDRELKEANRAWRFQRVMRGAKLVDSQLDFAAPRAGKIALDREEAVAFLLPEARGGKSTEKRAESAARLSPQDIPKASPDSALDWTVRVDLPEEFPDEQASVRVELFDMVDGRRLASADAPFAPGQQRQNLRGRAPAPAGGWLAGHYELRSSVVTPKGATPQGEPKGFSIGLIHWRKTTVNVDPAAVAAARYVLDSGIVIEREDGFAVRARGEVTPAPVSFYSELLENPRLTERVPSKPAGIPWSNNDLRLRKYRLVEAGANYAALLLRIEGQEWIPYLRDTAPMPSPASGAIQLSINSIVPRATDSSRNDAPIGREYWRPNCGQYEVTFYLGRFDFPEKLTHDQRAGLLNRFTN